jgi:hypothetical protein
MADGEAPKRYRVASGRNAEDLEKSLNELVDQGYSAVVALDAPNQTSLVVMEKRPAANPGP